MTDDTGGRRIIDDQLRCPNGHLLSVNIMAPAGGRFYCNECNWSDDELPPQPAEKKD